MSSKFFATAGSDVDSDDSGSDVSGMGGQMQNKEQSQAAMMMYDSSSSEEEKRVIRSGKDKRYEAMNATVKVLKNSMKINDWVSVLKGFETLNKVLEKSRAIILREGLPRVYVKTLVGLEDKLNEATQMDKDAKKKMSTANNRALNTLKQKLKKNNREYEKFIAEYRLAPDAHVKDEDEDDEKDSDSDESSDDSESEEEESDGDSGEDDDDDDKEDHDDDDGDDDDGVDDEDEFDFASDASSSSDDSEIDLSHPAMSRAFWVKKTKGDEGELSKAERRKQRQPKVQANREMTKAKNKTDASNETVKEIEFTPELIHQKLNAIQALRGKRGVDRSAAVKDLVLLSTKASTPAVVIKVKMILLSAMFDMNFNSGSHMNLSVWSNACTILNSVMASLEQNPNVSLIEDDDIEENVFAYSTPEGEQQTATTKDQDTPAILATGELNKVFIAEAHRKREDGMEYVAGSIFSFAARLADEFTSSLQNIEPHAQEYLNRLADEPTLLRLLSAAQTYYTKRNNTKFVCLLALIRLEFLSVKYDPFYDIQSPTSIRKVKTLDEDSDPLSVMHPDENVLFHRLCAIIYEHGDDRSKARVVICTAYHYAMHGAFHKARDLFLMSHVQDTIGQADISTQILYNRAISMMSIAAFRLGYMRESLQIVADLYATGKIKELLAQGVSNVRWNQERDTEQEKIERRRQVPYHLHISLDLLESVHLIAAMLLEVPNLAIHAHDDKRHVISRNFRRLFDSFNKNAFNGPPENTRDFVIAAAISLRNGEWQESYQHLMQLKMWPLIPHPDQTKAILKETVQRVGLQTFLLAHGAQYITIDNERLAERFGLTTQQVHSVSAKLMSQDKLPGAWDEPTNAIKMKAALSNPIQLAALRFADIVGIFVDQNERSMEHRNVHGKSGGSGKEGGGSARHQQSSGRGKHHEGGGGRRW